MIKQSKNLKYVHSDIRGPLYIEALRMEEKGIKVLKLNTGNPAKFGFTLPQSLRKDLVENIDEAVAYSDVKGMKQARQAILDYQLNKGFKNIDIDDIFLTNGVSEAANIVISSVLGEGDEILLPSPCYSLWSNNTYLTGAKPVFYHCNSETDWNPDIEDIKNKITSRTKALLIINPNNPTGSVYSKEVLLQIGEIAKENHLLLLADEIYDRLVMDDIKHDSIAALFPELPCITFNGLSKSHIICGFRCGWLVLSGNKEELIEIRDAIMKLTAMRLCSNTLTQLIIPSALKDELSTKKMLVKGGRLYEQRKACIDELNKIDGVSVIENKAAFYIFPKIDKDKFDFEDDYDFCMKFLQEKHILVIPGSGFDWHKDLRFRIVMLPEPKELAKAMKELADFLDNHRVSKQEKVNLEIKEPIKQIKINKNKVLPILAIIISLIAILYTYLNRNVYLIFTSDVHSYIYNSNSYETIKQVKKSYNKKGNTVLIDGGDFSQGNEPGDSSEGAEIIEMMNDANYDFATIGNHDFDFGLEALSDNINNAEITFLASNLTYTGDDEDLLANTKEYVIKKYGNIKIAFLGIVNPITTENGRDSADAIMEDGEYIYDTYHDFNDKSDDGSRLAARMQEIVNEVRDEVDYVVVVSHLGTNDNRTVSSRDLVKYVSGIDIILNGHSHNVENEYLIDLDGKQVLLMSVGKWFNSYGVIKLNKKEIIESELFE